VNFNQDDKLKLIARLTLAGSIRAKKNPKSVVPTRNFGGINPKTGKPYSRSWMFNFKGAGWQLASPKIVTEESYTKWQDSARTDALVHLYQRRFLKPTTKPVHVKMIAFYKGPKPDLSGSLESIGDCLQGVVWKDDSQIVSWDGSRLIHDVKNPRTEVTVWEEI
jgi:Holliday junction resolvase RusA-like endonuclease